jgi:hypothetical protein
MERRTARPWACHGVDDREGSGRGVGTIPDLRSEGADSRKQVRDLAAVLAPPLVFPGRRHRVDRVSEQIRGLRLESGLIVDAEGSIDPPSLGVGLR